MSTVRQYAGCSETEGVGHMTTGAIVATRDLLQRIGTIISTGCDLVCVRWEDKGGGVTSYTADEAEQELEVVEE